MCGFFAFAPDLTGSEINRILSLEENKIDSREWRSYKFYPKSQIPTVSKNSPNKMVMRYWSLIPRWYKGDPTKMKFATFNAKLEEIENKASYRGAWGNNQRCLIPASWFYEFENVESEEGQKKIPHRIQSRDESIMGIAGLYEVWSDVEGREMGSVTMLTRKAGKVVSKIHSREPVILQRESWDIWLNREVSSFDVLKNLRESDLEMFKIDPRFNKTRADEVTSEMVKRYNS